MPAVSTEILVRNRQAVERARRVASCKGLVGARGVGHRTLGHERHNRVHLGVDAFDARQVGSHDLAGRHLLRANPRGKLHRGQGAQIVAGGGRVRRHRLQHTAHGRRRDRLSEGAATDRSGGASYAIGPMTKIVLPNGSMTSKVLAPHDSSFGGLLMATRSRHS